MHVGIPNILGSSMGGGGIGAAGTVTNQMVRWNGSIWTAGPTDVLLGSSFISFGTPVAASGYVRVGGENRVVVGRGSGGADAVAMEVAGASDQLFIGTSSAYGNQWVTLRIYASSAIYIGRAGSNRIAIDGTETALAAINTGLFTGGGSYGGGAAVLFVGNRTTAPTTNPVAGAIVYAEGGAIVVRGSGGATTEAASVGSGTVASQNNLFLRRTGVVQTTDATPTTILTYSPPVNSGGAYRALVVGRNTTTDAIAAYQVLGGHSRAGAAPTVYTATTVIQEPAAGYEAEFVASGNDVILRVTGAAATTLDWQAVWEIVEN